MIKEAGFGSVLLGALRGQVTKGAEGVAAKTLLKTVGTHAAVGAALGGGAEAMRDNGNVMKGVMTGGLLGAASGAGTHIYNGLPTRGSITGVTQYSKPIGPMPPKVIQAAGQVAQKPIQNVVPAVVPGKLVDPSAGMPSQIGAVQNQRRLVNPNSQAQLSATGLFGKEATASTWSERMDKYAGVADLLTKDLVKHIGIGAATGAAGGLVLTGKDGSVSENILKGAIGGGLAGGAFHGINKNFAALKGMAHDANLLKGPTANALGKDSEHLLSRMSASSKRIASGSKERGMNEIHSAVEGMKGRLAGNSSEHANQLREKLQDISELAAQGNQSGFMRGLKKTVSGGGLFNKKWGQLHAFDSNLSASLDKHISDLQALHQ